MNQQVKPAHDMASNIDEAANKPFVISQTVENFLMSHYLISPAELKVLRFLVDGLTHKAANKLHGVNLNTMKAQVRSINNKTKQHSTARIIAFVYKLELIFREG